MGKVIHIHVHKKTTKDTLQGGKSKAAFSHNVKTEVAAGKPVKQAVAIAYSKQRETNDASPTSSGEEHWITINGTHVKISGKGEIVAGPKDLKAALEHHGKQAQHHEKKMLEVSAKGEHAKARQHQEAKNHHQLAKENLAQSASWKSKGEKTWSQAQASIAGFHAGKAAEIEKGLTEKPATKPASTQQAKPAAKKQAPSDNMKIVKGYSSSSSGRETPVWNIEENGQVVETLSRKSDATALLDKWRKASEAEKAKSSKEAEVKARQTEIKSIETEITRIENNPDNVEGGAKAFHSGRQTTLKPAVKKKLEKLNKRLDDLLDQVEQH